MFYSMFRYALLLHHRVSLQLKNIFERIHHKVLGILLTHFVAVFTSVPFLLASKALQMLS